MQAVKINIERPLIGKLAGGSRIRCEILPCGNDQNFGGYFYEVDLSSYKKLGDR